MYWLIWDSLTLLMIALLIWDCARKGFLGKIVGFAGAVASALLAAFFSAPLAVWLYDVLVRDVLRNVLTNRVTAALEEGFTSTGGLLGTLPGWAARLAETQPDLPVPQVSDQIIPAVEALIDLALAQSVILILRGLCFFALFTILMLLARRLSHLFEGVNRIPLVGSVNTVLGGVLGIAQAMLILYLLAVAARLLLTYTGGNQTFFNGRALGGGYLFSFFYRMTG